MPPEALVEDEQITDEIVEETPESTPEETPPADPPPADPTPPSLRDRLQNEYGVELGEQYGDDTAVLAALADTYRNQGQLEQLAALGQRYLANQDQFEQFQAQQQGQAAPAPEKGWQWDAPEFDPQWLTQVQRDAQNNLVPIQGGNPVIAQKVNDYIAWRQGRENQFWNNPESVIGPLIEQYINEKAAPLIEEKLGSYGDQQTQNDFVRQNATWLFENDDSGQIVYNQANQPMLSKEGHAFQGYMQEASNMGIQGMANQQNYATQMVARDRAVAGQKPAAPPKPRGAVRTPSRNIGNRLNGNQAPASVPGNQSIADRLRAAFDGEGITEENIDS